MSLAQSDGNAGSNSFDILSVGDLIEFLTRYWLLITGCAVAAGVSVGVLLPLLVAPTYSSSALLVVVPPKVVSDLNPVDLSIQGYEKLLRSDAVLFKVQERLVDEGVFEPGERPSLGADLESEIFVSRRQDTTSLAPVIRAEGRAATPEKAARLANVWAEVFLLQIKEIVELTTSREVVFVEAEYPRISRELEARELEMSAAQNEFQEKYQQIQTEGDRRIAAFNRRTLELVADHNAESRVLIDSLASQTFEEISLDEPDEGRTPFAETLSALAGVRAQMAQTHPVLVLEKAVSDDALWQSLIQERSKGPTTAEPLLTQEVNPIYSDLALRAIQIETELRYLVGEEQGKISKLVRQLERLQQERSDQLASLKEERSLGATTLARQQQRELERLEREHGLLMAKLERLVYQLTILENELADNYGQAALATAQKGIERVYVVSPAVAVGNVLPRRVAVWSLVAVVLGGLLGMAISAFLEVSQHYRAQ